MKIRVASIILFLFFLIGCEKSVIEDPVMLVIDTYSPAKSTGAKPNGNFDSQPVDVYIGNELIGSTPAKFTQSKLKELNLPVYKSVSTESGGHWNTWDIDGHSSLIIRHEQKDPNQKKLSFRSRSQSDGESLKFSGYTNSKNSDGLQTILIQFQEKDIEPSE